MHESTKLLKIKNKIKEEFVERACLTYQNMLDANNVLNMKQQT